MAIKLVWSRMGKNYLGEMGYHCASSLNEFYILWDLPEPCQVVDDDFPDLVFHGLERRYLCVWHKGHFLLLYRGGPLWKLKKFAQFFEDLYGGK